MLKKYINIYYGIDSMVGDYSDKQDSNKVGNIKSETGNEIIEQFNVYEVKKGDTLYSILSTKYKDLFSSFKNLSDKLPPNIKPGDKISFYLIDKNSAELHINDNIYVLNKANKEVYEITNNEKEVLQDISDSLKKLLDIIKPSEELKEIYFALDILLTKEKFSLNQAIEIQNKLNNNWRKFLGSEYKNDPKAQEAIKIYNVVFLSLDSDVDTAVNIISEVFDDKNIPKGIKLKLAQYLREGVLPYMITKKPGFEDIDYKELDDTLKEIYDYLKTLKYINSLDEYNKLFSYQDILYSPKYENNKNARVLRDIISEKIGDYTPILDTGKGIEISNELIKKYPEYNWDLVYSFPSD